MKGKVAAVAVAAVLALAAPVVTRWEGVRYVPYWDAVGVLTVCYGHTGPDVKPGRKYTEAECRALLDADMLEANGHVRRCVGRAMPPRVEAALISLTFNVGPRAVCSGTPGRFARAGDWAGTCASLDLYKYAGGRVYRGLELRRADERALCEGRA